MSQQESHFELTLDMKCFAICPWCLRVIPILLAEGYLLYLFSKQLLKTKRYYDSLDKTIFFLSVISIATSFISILFLEEAISSFSYLIKIIWTLSLLLVFLRFLFKDHQCSKLFLLTIIFLMCYYFLMMFFFRVIPIRYSLLVLYIGIGICAFHQIINIRERLNNERARKKELKKFIEKKNKEIEMELLDKRQKNDEVYLKPLSNPFKYHIKLRKTFATAVIISLTLNYFFLWDLQQSRNSLGQFFVVFISELLPLLVYFLFTSGNQWLLEQIKQIQEERRTSRLSSRNSLNSRPFI